METEEEMLHICVEIIVRLAWKKRQVDSSCGEKLNRLETGAI